MSTAGDGAEVSDSGGEVKPWQKFVVAALESDAGDAITAAFEMAEANTAEQVREHNRGLLYYGDNPILFYRNDTAIHGRRGDTAMDLAMRNKKSGCIAALEAIAAPANNLSAELETMQRAQGEGNKGTQEQEVEPVKAKATQDSGGGAAASEGEG
jgi:hypothetical protein